MSENNWAAHLDSGESETLRILKERVADLENGLTTLHLQFGEPYYSWQRVLYRVQQLIRRRNQCAEACLNAIGFLDGKSVLTKSEITQRLVDAVTLIVSGEEPPEYRQSAVTTNSVSQSYSAPEADEPMRIIRDEDSHWYIIPEARQDDFSAYVRATRKGEPWTSDWTPEMITNPASIRIFNYENLDA